jgi:hypothetical protein
MWAFNVCGLVHNCGKGVFAMSLRRVLCQYEDLSSGASDFLGIPVLSRRSAFLEILESYLSLASVKLTKTQLNVAELVFYRMIFGSTKILFENEAKMEAKKIPLFLSRMLEMGDQEFSTTGVASLGDLLVSDRASKAIVQAVITESCLRQRVSQAVIQKKRLNLIYYFRIFAALKLSHWDFELHDKLLATPLKGIPTAGSSACQLDNCSAVSSAVIVCPERDGQEYICQAHKGVIASSFTAYRYVFSRSCGHSPDVSKCKVEAIPNGANVIPIAVHFGKDQKEQQ